MRSRGLSFADAVKLPDGDSALVSQLGQIAGIPAGAVTIASGGGLDFFALRDLRRPRRVDGFRAEMSAAEQVAVTTSTRPGSTFAEVATTLIEQPVPAPSPRLPFERSLTHFYLELSAQTFEFLGGLRSFEGSKPSKRSGTTPRPIVASRSRSRSSASGPT